MAAPPKADELYGLLAEFDDRRSGLEIAHIHRFDYPMQYLLGQLVKRWVAAQELEDFELLVLHFSAFSSDQSISGRAVRTTGP